MSEKDQLLEPTGQQGERVAKVRFSREGGLEELVRELTVGNKFVLSFPCQVRLDEVEQELCFEFSMNIGVEPHPGLHCSIAFDLPVPGLIPRLTKIDELRSEILAAGGDPDEVITPETTEEKAKEVLDALQGGAS